MYQQYTLLLSQDIQICLNKIEMKLQIVSFSNLYENVSNQESLKKMNFVCHHETKDLI